MDWKKITLSFVFFSVTPLALVVSLFALDSYSFRNSQTQLSHISERSGFKVYASLPSDYPSFSGQVNSSDAREELVRKYLTYYDSPLADLSNHIVSTSDKYGLDWRLTTAIAQQESNLCNLFPPGTFNCWGWGIHSQGTLGFSSYSEAIEEVSRGIKESYINEGLITPEEIMSKYTPLSQGSWAYGVNLFMDQIEKGF